MLFPRKRYETGGGIPYGIIGDSLSQVYDQVTPTDQYNVKSKGNAALVGGLKGAGTGAAAGAAFGPYGAAAGAIIGGTVGSIKGLADRKKQVGLRTDFLNAKDQAATLYGQQVLAQTSQGSYDNQIYAEHGGLIPIGKASKGLIPLSSNTAEVKGPSHENGGVQITPRVEVEGGETLSNNYVFSEELGFAQKHKPIAKQIGKLEKRPQDKITQSTIDRLKQREESLKVEQENVKDILGLNSSDKYTYGGPALPPPYLYNPNKPQWSFPFPNGNNIVSPSIGSYLVNGAGSLVPVSQQIPRRQQMLR